MNNKAYREYLEKLRTNAEIGYSKDPFNRSYKERCDIWYYEHALNPDPNSWDEGEEIEIYDGESLANNKIKNPYNNSDFPEYFRKLGNHFGEKVYYNNKIYTLKGVSYTYIDYYYILEDESKDKSYITCCKEIKFLLFP